MSFYFRSYGCQMLDLCRYYHRYATVLFFSIIFANVFTRVEKVLLLYHLLWRPHLSSQQWPQPFLVGCFSLLLLWRGKHRHKKTAVYVGEVPFWVLPPPMDSSWLFGAFRLHAPPCRFNRRNPVNKSWAVGFCACCREFRRFCATAALEFTAGFCWIRCGPQAKGFRLWAHVSPVRQR